MIKLHERMVAYMHKYGDGVWVSKNKLKNEAEQNKFTYSQTMNAFQKLDEMPEVGKIMRLGETYYCWYDITPEQRERMEKQKALWDSL